MRNEVTVVIIANDHLCTSYNVLTTYPEARREVAMMCCEGVVPHHRRITA